jgi:hypothetical protein
MVVPSEVLVVEETPSLAGSIVSLLESEGYPARPFADLRGAEEYHVRAGLDHPVVVVASNTHFCPTASRWALGPLRDAALIVVGTRDPALRSAGRLHVLALPLRTDGLLDAVRRLARPVVP